MHRLIRLDDLLIELIHLNDAHQIAFSTSIQKVIQKFLQINQTWTVLCDFD